MVTMGGTTQEIMVFWIFPELILPSEKRLLARMLNSSSVVRRSVRIRQF
jgi:hypothetical protein